LSSKDACDDVSALESGSAAETKFKMVSIAGGKRNDANVPVPLQSDLVTLSALPAARWKNLPYLDLVKERNKPSQAPEAPADAPFFLSTMDGLAPTLDPFSDMEAAAAAKAAPAAADAKSGSHVIKSGGGIESTPLLALLETLYDATEGKAVALAANATPLKTVNAVTHMLRKMSPAGIDGEIRALGLNTDTEERELAVFLNYFALALPLQHHFEFLQALLNLFLTVHAETIVTYPALAQHLTSLSSSQSSVWSKMQQHFHSNLCLVQFFSNTQM
jgi:U3 small nucleolar RNA-associated protein 21